MNNRVRNVLVASLSVFSIFCVAGYVGLASMKRCTRP